MEKTKFPVAPETCELLKSIFTLVEAHRAAKADDGKISKGEFVSIVYKAWQEREGFIGIDEIDNELADEANDEAILAQFENLFNLSNKELENLIQLSLRALRSVLRVGIAWIEFAKAQTSPD